jgi:hypothetical protein
MNSHDLDSWLHGLHKAKAAKDDPAEDEESEFGPAHKHVCIGRANLPGGSKVDARQAVIPRLETKVEKHNEGQHDQLTHGNWAEGRYPEDSDSAARDAALEYCFSKKLRYDHKINYREVVANRERASRIADVYEQLPKMDREAIDEYQALATEVEEQFDYMVNKLGIKVEFVDYDPYKGSKEMFADAQRKRLKVLRTAKTGAHPFFTDEQNDKFRAVHDYFGHAATGRGFGQDGEEAAWVHHSQMFSAVARMALTTETRGQNSFFNNRGKQFADQKVALLPPEFWEVPDTFSKLWDLRKHYEHDQRTHGNWARGVRSDPTTPGRLRYVPRGVRRDKDGVAKLWTRDEVEKYAGVNLVDPHTEKIERVKAAIEGFGIAVEISTDSSATYDVMLGALQAVHDLRETVSDDIWAVVQKRLKVDFTSGSRGALASHQVFVDEDPEDKSLLKMEVVVIKNIAANSPSRFADQPLDNVWTAGKAFVQGLGDQSHQAIAYASFMHEFGHHLMDSVGGREGFGVTSRLDWGGYQPGWRWVLPESAEGFTPETQRFRSLVPRVERKRDRFSTFARGSAQEEALQPIIPRPKGGIGPYLPFTFDKPPRGAERADKKYWFSRGQGISTYSTTNAEEMYAESFSMWMLFGGGANQLKGSNRARWAKAKLGSATNYRNFEDQIVPFIVKAAAGGLCGTCGSAMPIEMQWLEYQAKKAKAVRKGDRPGHKFRGNQHTGGISDPSAAGSVRSMSNRAVARTVAGLGPSLDEAVEIGPGFANQASPRPAPKNSSDVRRRPPTKVMRVKDLDKAAKLAALGYVVEVDSVDEAHTLIEELARMAVEASKREGRKVSYNLCNVSVAGSNLFCSESYDLARTQMPQFSADAKTGVKEGSRASKLKPNDRGEVSGVDDFKTYAKSKGYKLTNRKVQASRLKATQKELGSDKVGGMMNNEKFDPEGEPIFVSRDGYVIDGHHRWAAQLGRDLRDGKLGDKFLNVIEVDAPITEILPFANKWAEEYGFLPQKA